ncbi:MAG: hypothetical protein ACRDNO_27375 [Trebonia sp.]
MTTAVIVDIVRTASGKGKPGGALSGVHPADLLAQTLTALVERNGLTIDAIDAYEVNEAFAPVPLAGRRTASWSTAPWRPGSSGRDCSSPAPPAAPSTRTWWSSRPTW